MPSYTIRANDMAEKASNVTQAIGLVSVNGLVVLDELLLKLVCPEAIETGKPLTN